jgi:two-component system sensor histidine kinase/response regulator
MDKKDISNVTPDAILIVDDNPHNLQVLGKMLQENRYKIEFATNGVAALDWLDTRQFGLILLDVNMPGMNGFEVCTKIRSRPALNNVPVIFLSADTDRESILKGFELGAQDYITKPFDSRELLLRVRTHLSLKDNIEKLAKLNESLEDKVKERTEQLNEANELLETQNLKLMDLDRAKASFLKLISHEIRTPLNGIIGPLELLKGPLDASDIADLIDILDSSVKRLERFSLNALLITRLKTNQQDIRKDELRLSAIIDDLLEEEKERLGQGNKTVKRINQVSIDLICGEAELIRKCIGNIIDNAIIFSPDNSTIEVRTFVDNQNIVCEINDSGKGFEDETINRVFELFSAADEYKDNSTGTGISLAKMIIEAHGGNIQISNNPAGGASVKLLFKKMVKVVL